MSCDFNLFKDRGVDNKCRLCFKIDTKREFVPIDLVIEEKFFQLTQIEVCQQSLTHFRKLNK